MFPFFFTLLSSFFLSFLRERPRGREKRRKTERERERERQIIIERRIE